MKLEDTCSLVENYDKPREYIKTQRHHFVNEFGQSYGFSIGHVWVWELYDTEDWASKNWGFRTVVLEKTLGSPLDCKEIQPIHPRGDQSWVFIGRSDVEAETPIRWPPDVKSWFVGKTLMLGKIEGRRRRGRRSMRWSDGITNSQSTPRAYSHSRPPSRWCHSTLLFSVVSFSSCLRSFPALGLF